MPSRSTATLGTSTSTTTIKTNAVRKTTKTSAYFRRSQRKNAKGKTKQDESGNDAQTEKESVTRLDASLGQADDALLRDDYDDDSSTLREILPRSVEEEHNILTLDTQPVPLSSDQKPKPKPKRSQSTSPQKKPPKLSPYFPKPLPFIETSCLPFPPISASSFGLIQEQLAHQPFRLLIATIFLNRTRGPVAIPVLFKLFDKYPTINSMADANHADIVALIRGLGFQNQRATKFIALAHTWLDRPPQRGKRYRKLHYPCKGDGADVASDEVIGEEDARVAWEIAHLPGVGAYAIDSWRIFCRDSLLSDSHVLEPKAEVEPEWKRVLPQDKELRAYLTWMWLKEGWLWDPETGGKTLADAGMMERAARGGVAYEAPNGNWVLEEMLSTEKRDAVLGVRRAGFSLAYSEFSEVGAI